MGMKDAHVHDMRFMFICTQIHLHIRLHADVEMSHYRVAKPAVVAALQSVVACGDCDC